MGKSTIKKGKQKEPTPAIPANVPVPPPSPPPPALVASPPAAHHIPHLSATIDTIQEEEVLAGQGGPAVSGEEESWQDVGQSAADSWGADIPGNSNGDLGEDGWETGLAQAPIPMPSPQPPPKNSGRGKDATSHHPQLQLRMPSNPQNSKGPTANASAYKSSAGSWGYAQPRPPQDTWIPEEDQWSEDGGWGPGEDDGDDGGADGGWGGAGGGWGQQPHSAAWAHAVSAHSAHSQTSSHAPTGTGWQSWGEEARRLPKVTFDPAIPPSPSSTGSKPVLSQTQRSQILNELLNEPRQNQQLYPMPPNPFPPVANITQHQHGNRHQQHHGPHRSYGQHHGQGGKNLGSEPRHQVPRAQPHGRSHDGRQREEVHDAWGLGGEWNDLQTDDEEQDMAQDPWDRRVHFSPGTLRASMPPSAVVENITVNALPQNKLGISTIPMSKTLSYAYSGRTPSAESEPGRAAMQRITDFHFVESRGDALKGVQNAFYGKRKATDRFHWLFPPEKDERVLSLLNWINSMSFGVASFGLQKFLQTRERGALMVNAAYRPVHSPAEPAFDWITWNQIQQTMDRVLQESVGYYNPAIHIIVFVLLPSPTGNSVAIWRRKLPIPNNIRLAYQAQLTQALASLRKEYPVLVDELPASPELASPPPPPKKKKRKWYKLWLFS